VDIGDVIYSRHSQGDGIDNELSSLCQEIDRHYLKIREYKDNAANLKGEKICPSCEREVDINVSFCPYCGTPCPTPEAAEDVEGEAVPAEETAEGSNGSNGTETAQTAETSDASGASQEQPLEKETMEEQPAEEINDQKAEDTPEE